MVDNFYTPEEKKRIEELKTKTKETDNHEYLRKYTTDMTLIYEKARVRRGRKRSGKEDRF
ncbi:hypothetical protein [Salsuginibacillus kocurii]|uniref:hypothetical protein n=1 Tax=Salsuginibacillus kocurii TaxID=427078 RepID=UPI00037ADCFC|nr:hypothetical protein [Salsuginibacillus kocurii]